MDHFQTTRLQFREVMLSINTFALPKGLWAWIVGVCAYVFGIENYDFLIALFLLVIIDLITGISASVKHGYSIESRKVFKTATKTVVYLLFVAAAHLTTRIVPASDFIAIGVVSFLGLTEFFSIMENIAKCGYRTPKKLLNQKDVMKMVERTSKKKGR